MRRIKNIMLAVASVAALSACSSDYLEVAPQDKISDASAFKDLKSAQNVLRGCYEWMHNGWVSMYLDTYMFFMPDVMGDDAVTTSTGNYNRWNEPYQYNFTKDSGYTDDPWQSSYSLIHNCNVITDFIDRLPEGAERDQIEGEAKALRAYAFHFLIRMYGKPVSVAPDSPGVVLRIHQDKEPMGRATVQEVYDQMVADIEDACTKLDASGRTEKAYITAQGAHAIAARIYLDLGMKKEGVAHADAAVKGATLVSTEAGYEDVYVTNNSETIWYYPSTSDDKAYYLSQASFWYYADGFADGAYTDKQSGYSCLSVTRNLIDLYDDADIRKRANFAWNSDTNDWLAHYKGDKNTYMVRKVHSTTDFSLGEHNYLRASEMYLIKAELLADAGETGDAKDALDIVRQARGLDKYTGSDLINEIQNERRRELVCEGHRFFDIKRRGQALKRTGIEGHWGNPVLDLPANSDKMELPIPQDEIDANDGLTDEDQNPEYK